MASHDPTRIGEVLAEKALAVAAKNPHRGKPRPSRSLHDRALEDRWQRICPPRFRSARIEDHDDVDDLAEWADNPTGTLLILGPVGTGKTHAAWATLRRIAERGTTVAGIGASSYVDAGRPGGAGDTWRNAPVLLVDDLGAEHSTDWASDRIYTLVDHRWQHELPTIVTTNLGREGFQAAVGGRVWSRLVDDITPVVLGGTDRRAGR